MPDLSVLIPSRNEPYLKNTVEDILKNARADTEVIVILDGGWPVEPLAQHEKVTLVYHPKSVGQRAATNEAARLSNAKYVMKLDAHCSLAEGFDVELIKGAQALGPDVTQIPLQCNLHVFSWVCDSCGDTTYQGPNLKSCAKCNGTAFHKDLVWKPRRGVKTTSWHIDSELHFGYWGEYSRRPEVIAQGDFPETMSALGACFFMERDYFWRLDGLDERTGSWGQYGQEVACKTWLSGGRHVTNKRTWFAHLFRTQGGEGFSFPYEIHGSDQEKARKYARDYWRNNRWPKQIYPLSWLVDKFWVVPGWTDEARAKITAAGVEFTLSRKNGSLVGGVVGIASTGDGARGDGSVLFGDRDTRMAAPQIVGVACGKGMTSLAEGLPMLPPSRVLGQANETQVGGVDAAGRVAHDMIQHETVGPERDAVLGKRLDQPSEEESVDKSRDGAFAEPGDLAVSPTSVRSCPEPASSFGVDDDSRENSTDGAAIEVGDNQVSHSSSPYQTAGRSGTVGATTSAVPKHILPPNPTKGLIYYSDCRPDPTILSAVRQILVRATPGLRRIAVTLAPIPDAHLFDKAIVLDKERGYLTMFEQILRGLEESDADVIYLCEHDVAYHPSHFGFVPPRGDVYYYDLSVWKVDAATGRTLHYITRQTSGLCASRSLLLEHYRKRVERVEREGFSRKMGFEPGSHHRAERVDDYGAEDWRSAVPNVDIRHDKNLTGSRWTKEEFRSQRNCQGWTEGDSVPGWPGQTKGRFAEWLADVVKER